MTAKVVISLELWTKINQVIGLACAIKPELVGEMLDFDDLDDIEVIHRND